jgi:hypothetical protein
LLRDVAQNGTLGPAVEAAHAIAALCGVYHFSLSPSLCIISLSLSLSLSQQLISSIASAHESMLALETAAALSMARHEQNPPSEPVTSLSLLSLSLSLSLMFTRKQTADEWATTAALSQRTPPLLADLLRCRADPRVVRLLLVVGCWLLLLLLLLLLVLLLLLLLVCACFSQHVCRHTA